MYLSESVAFILHEEWRKTRLNVLGEYAPRWKKIKDKKFCEKFDSEDLPTYIRKTADGYEIDIANASYNLLSPDWQNENKAAAEVVAKIIESGKQYSREEIGEIIHRAWLDRNSWAKDGELGVPFAELPEEEQYKDLVQYDIALKMSQAEELSAYYNDLDSAINALQEAKDKGQNVYYDFNGNSLYSLFDTPDTCYLKVCKMTRKQREEFEERWLREYREREAREKAEAESKIPAWEKRGEALIYPEKTESWHKCVKIRARDLYHGAELENALEVMEALEAGKSYKEIKKIISEAGHSGMSEGMMCNIVLNFSKHGPKFIREYRGSLSPESEAYVKKIESENEIYKANEKQAEDTPLEKAGSTAAIISDISAQPVESKDNRKE